MRFVAGCLMLLALASPVHAESSFNILAYGRGFTDPTRVVPVGGNMGTTRGEQRRLALQFAANIWGKLLDSNVPIEVRVNFHEMGCGEGRFKLASATTGGMVVFDSEPIGEPGIAYPYALANRLAGADLDPHLPDIDMNVNTSVDDEVCSSPSLRGFYYGLDGRGPSYLVDLVSTALHELGHGLGFLSRVDQQTGAPILMEELDIYSSHLRDLALDRSWKELSGPQRVQSLRRPHGLVFDGAELNEAARSFLTEGTPALTLSPTVPGFAGFVADTGFAVNPALSPVRGEVVEAGLAPGCGELRAPQQAAGRIAFINFSAAGCRASETVQLAQNAGALGVLLPFVSSGQLATPFPESAPPSTLPVLVLSEGDGAALHAALQRGTVTANMGGDANQQLGADKKGRMLLFTPDELAAGSSLSHFDPSARPDLLMEPFMSKAAQHDVDLTLALLRDLGWTSMCGNGAMDYGEECDAAQQNGDGTDAPCRKDCLLPGCGDGLIDADEACDDGRDNSDSLPSACRTDCSRAHCGDGVLEPGEQCDDGPRNGELAPAVCTPQCRLVESPTDASVAAIDQPDAATPGDDAAIEQMANPMLRPWGRAPSPRREDAGCHLAAGAPASALADLAMLALACVLVRRRR
jgi:cysteine-rich repeat protein